MELIRLFLIQKMVASVQNLMDFVPTADSKLIILPTVTGGNKKEKNAHKGILVASIRDYFSVCRMRQQAIHDSFSLSIFELQSLKREFY